MVKTKTTVVVFICVVLQLLSLATVSGEFLRVQGRDLYYGTNKVFLSGPNIAWKSYGYDFGNNQYDQNSRGTYEEWISQISQAGGNSLRVWIHVEGENTPEWDGNGYVISTDRAGSLIPDLQKLLTFAAQHNVLVIPVLWNGALMRNQRYVDLVWDDSKLNSYIWQALRPMVQALKNYPALGAWEIMNEPEGSVRIEGNSNPCYNTEPMGQHGAGWTGVSIPMERFLRFINLQAAAIKAEDPKVLVTLGSWSEHPQSDAYDDTVNYYKDSCLRGAGGEQSGTIDFYQMHTYSWEGRWNPHSPFVVSADSFNLDKPLVIGEFSADCAAGEGIEALFDKSYNTGYDGAWSWQYNSEGHCSDSRATQDRGMYQIRGYTHNGNVAIDVR